MDRVSTTCEDCPFQRYCPLKSHVASPCVIGRNPLKVYLTVWAMAVAGSIFIS